MLTILGSILTSVMSGGATGLLGIVFQRFFDARSKAQDIEVIRLNHANAVDLKRLELESLDKQVAGATAVAQAQRDAIMGQAEFAERTAEYQGDTLTLTASIAADRATYLTAEAQASSKSASILMAVVDFLRGVTRPLLTLYLVVLAHMMFLWCRELAAAHGGLLGVSELKEIVMLVLSTLLYLATVAVVWWFGTRPPRKAVSHT